MAWIESHQTLEKHSKMLKMSIELEWETDKTIGFLHRFWWFVLIHAEDGDLSKHTVQSLGMSLGVPNKVIESLYTNGWIDKDTHLVHDWFDYAGYYLKMKYHTSNPKKYTKIQKLYTRNIGTPKGTPKGRLKETPPYPYPLPNPNKQKTDIQLVVLAYKQSKGFEENDKAWDKQHFGRSTASAKDLLSLLGNVDTCIKCIEDIKTQMGAAAKGDGLTWTLETVARHSHEWYKKHKVKREAEQAQAKEQEKLKQWEIKNGYAQ